MSGQNYNKNNTGAPAQQLMFNNKATKQLLINSNIVQTDEHDGFLPTTEHHLPHICPELPPSENLNPNRRRSIYDQAFDSQQVVKSIYDQDPHLEEDDFIDNRHHQEDLGLQKYQTEGPTINAAAGSNGPSNFLMRKHERLQS